MEIMKSEVLIVANRMGTMNKWSDSQRLYNTNVSSWETLTLARFTRCLYRVCTPKFVWIILLAILF